MAAPDVKKLLELDVETRLEIVQQIWDSIVDDATAGARLPVSAGDRAVLDQRLREDDDNPAEAIPWSEVKARLRREG